MLLGEKKAFSGSVGREQEPRDNLGRAESIGFLSGSRVVKRVEGSEKCEFRIRILVNFVGADGVDLKSRSDGSWVGKDPILPNWVVGPSVAFETSAQSSKTDSEETISQFSNQDHLENRRRCIKKKYKKPLMTTPSNSKCLHFAKVVKEGKNSVRRKGGTGIGGNSKKSKKKEVSGRVLATEGGVLREVVEDGREESPFILCQATQPPRLQVYS